MGFTENWWAPCMPVWNTCIAPTFFRPLPFPARARAYPLPFIVAHPERRARSFYFPVFCNGNRQARFFLRTFATCTVFHLRRTLLARVSEAQRSVKIHQLFFTRHRNAPERNEEDRLFFQARDKHFVSKSLDTLGIFKFSGFFLFLTSSTAKTNHKSLRVDPRYRNKGTLITVGILTDSAANRCARGLQWVIGDSKLWLVALFRERLAFDRGRRQRYAYQRAQHVNHGKLRLNSQ